MLNFSYLQVFLFFILGSATYDIAKGLGIYLKAKNRHGEKITWCSAVSLWQLFLLLAMFQYFLAIESTPIHAEVGPGEMILHVISVMCFALMATLIIPDLNAPDVQEVMKNDPEGYKLSEFYRRHRKSLALAGTVFLVCAIINYQALNGSFDGYLTKRLPFHAVYVVILSILYFSDPKNPSFTLIHRVIATMAVFFELVIIFFAMN